MKYKWQITTIALAVVVVTLSVSLLFDKENTTVESLSSEQVAIENIMTRTSVRKYTDQRVSDEMVDKMLRAGMAAPTAGNRQPWEFYVVRDTNIIEQMTSVTQFAAPMNDNAQLAIVVCGVPAEAFPIEPNYWVQDVSAASENILLAAHAMGLGAVWCGVYPGPERVLTLRNLLGVPEDLTPFNIIMIGHPDQQTSIKDKFKPEKIHYIGK